MTEQRHHNRNPKKVMAQEQKKTSKNTNSRRRGSARGRNANGSNSRTPSRKINATRQATAPQQDAVLIAPPKYRKGSMRITPLGGLGEIGRNMNVIEYNGHLLLIDCGVLFPEEEQPGVDLILPDFHYIKDRLDKVEALVLTHGHEDHIGGVPYLREYIWFRPHGSKFDGITKKSAPASILCAKALSYPIFTANF